MSQSYEKSAHTPGPWELDASGITVIHADADAGDDGRPRYYLEPICEMADTINADANARLICAAPALLEALRHCATDEGPEQEWLNRARAAIAKAEGRDNG